MITNRLSLVSEMTVLDSDTNSFSVFNILEDVVTEGFPVFFPKIAFLTAWQREDADPGVVECIIIVRTHEGELARQNVLMNFQDKNITRINARFQGIVIQSAGFLEFRLEGPGITATAVRVNLTRRAPAH